MAAPSPPRLAQWLLARHALGGRRETVEAELLELFHGRALERGRAYAACRYYADVISLWLYWRAPSGTTRTTFQRARIRWTDMRHDIIYALRVFRRQPVLFGLTIGGLALAMAISTSLFGVLNAAHWRGVGIVDQDDVVLLAVEGIRPQGVTGGTSYLGSWSRAWYDELARTVTAGAVAAQADSRGSLAIAAGSTPAQATVRLVSGNFFQVLGAELAMGRPLLASDDDPAAEPVTVVSHGFWRVHLAGDPNVVGRRVYFNDTPLRIVGVADRAFLGPGRSQAPPPLWMTFGAQDTIEGPRQARRLVTIRRELAALDGRPELTGDDLEWREALAAEQEALARGSNPLVDVIARLEPGRTEAELLGEASAVARGLPGSGGRATLQSGRAPLTCAARTHRN